MEGITNLLSTQKYLFMAVVAVLGFAVFKLSLYFIIHSLLRVPPGSKDKFKELLARGLKKIRWPFLFIFSLWLATKYLNLPKTLNQIFDDLVIAATVWTLIKITDAIAREFVAYQKTKDEQAQPIVNFFAFTIKLILVLVGSVLILSNSGFNVSSLITGLGVSSVVLIFVLQNILLDIFSALSIYLDKPFVVGDFIIVGADKGWVKKIGVRSTRLETTDGQKVIISNRLVTGAAIYNLETIKEQLVKFGLKLDYKTSATNCRLALRLIKEAISSTEYARFKQAHFTAFGDTALIYEVAYWVKGADAKRQLDVQQSINFKIKRGFEQSNINLVH